MIKIAGKYKRDFIQFLKTSKPQLYSALPEEAGLIQVAMSFDGHTELGCAYAEFMEPTHTSKVREEFDFFRSLQYALGYNADFHAMMVVNVPAHDGGKDFMLQPTRDELITIITARREKLREQLSSI